MRFEALETREVLAIDCLAAITGTVFTDMTDNGLTGDDTLLNGATVNLYMDGGDNNFDAGAGGGDDTLVGTRMTNAQGVYRFDDLQAGRYFVEQVPVTGLLQRPGTNVVTVDVSAAQAAGVSGTSIDTFTTAQMVVASSTGSTTDSNATAAAEALGGERDMFVQLTSAMGDISLTSDAFTMQVLEFAASSTGAGIRRVVWDGPDGDATTLDPIGLQTGGTGVDLTRGGLDTGLRVRIGADQTGGDLVFQVFTDAGNSSTVTVAIPGTGAVTPQNVFVPFSSFATATGTGADFADVGAIQMDITGAAAVDGQLVLLETIGPTVLTQDFANLEPLVVGDLVWNDANNNGVFDSGTESGIDGVVVNLFEDTDASGDFTPGTDNMVGTATTMGGGLYSFGNLLPGDYILQVDPANFTAGNPLANFASTGTDPAPSPNTDINDDDNGSNLAGQGVVTTVVTLSSGGEPVNDGDTSNDTNLSVDFGFVSITDLAITKTDNPDPVANGNMLVYTLTVTNNGPADASGVMVSDTLPAGVTFVSANASQGTTNQAGGTVTADLGNLLNGAMATVTVTVTVDQATVGTLSNVATVSGNEFDDNMTNNSATEPTTITPLIDLAVTKTDSADPVIAGQQLTYTVTVDNNGPSNATGVMVTDTLPAGVTFVSATPSQGTATHNAGVVTADLGAINSGANATIMVVVTVDAATRGTITNMVTVTGTQMDTNTANNSANEPTVVNAETDLQAAKTDSVDPVIAGQQLTYNVTITNNGPSTATGVTATDTLPAGVTFVSATPSQGTATEAAGVITADLGTINSGANATIAIVVTVDQDTRGTFDNTVSVTGTETDPTPANNMDSEPTQVNAEVDLVIAKADSPDPVNAGSQLTYTLTVTNNGPSQATNVTVTDTLPAGVTFSSGMGSQGTVTNNGNMVTAMVGTLNSGANATVTIVVDVDATTQGMITNTAVVTQTETDTNTANNTANETTTVELVNASIAGFVYIDADNDGVRDTNELPVAGVTITLTGTDNQGNAVNRTTMTATDGSYLFDNLAAGTYQVVETHPTFLDDGRDTQGAPALGAVANDMFTGIVLATSIDATNYNFGELISKRRFLASS